MKINLTSNPKVLVLGANKGNWHSSEKAQFGKSTSGIESWAFAFDGYHYNTMEADSNLISQFDIVIANSNIGMYLKHLLKLAESRPENVKWVTLIEGTSEDYLKYIPHLRELFDCSDLINCINQSSIELFKCLTKTKVEYIGIPYPVDYISNLAIPFENRSREIFLCPYLLSRWNDYFVGRELGIKMYGFEERLHRKLPNIPKMIKKNHSLNANFKLNKARNIYNDSNLSILKGLATDDYYKYTAKSFIWLNLDNRWTWARYILDAAALKMPIISTRSTSHAVDLFPDLCLENEFAIDKAISLGKRLIQDFDFYKSVADVPISKLEKFKVDVMKNKLLKALE